MRPGIRSLVVVVAAALLAGRADTGSGEPLTPDFDDPAREIRGEGSVVEELGGETPPRPETGSQPSDLPQLEPGAISRLAWLAGCWRGEAGEECWLEPRGGMMIAVNRGPATAGEEPFFELLRIVEDAEGLVFLAQPRGVSPAVPFRAVELGEARVVFANLEHDFPQRITYWREGERLRVRVEAQKDGEWGGFEQSWSPAGWPGG